MTTETVAAEALEPPTEVVYAWRDVPDEDEGDKIRGSGIILAVADWRRSRVS